MRFIIHFYDCVRNCKKQTLTPLYSIEAWTNETCGLQIKNITMEDSGFWRLTSISTAQNDKNVARGLAYINVQSKFVFDHNFVNVKAKNLKFAILIPKLFDLFYQFISFLLFDFQFVTSGSVQGNG